jgi:hypothetical protein
LGYKVTANNDSLQICETQNFTCDINLDFLQAKSIIIGDYIALQVVAVNQYGLSDPAVKGL